MTALFTFEQLAHLVGLMLAIIAFGILRDRSNPRRHSSALFWGLIACCLLFDQVAVDLLGKQIAYRAIGAPNGTGTAWFFNDMDSNPAGRTDRCKPANTNL